MHHHFSSFQLHISEFCPWKLSTPERTFTVCPSLPWGQFNKTFTSVVHKYIALVLQSENNIVATAACKEISVQ